jgi:tetratricopeptide (TPR) repeat protein
MPKNFNNFWPVYLLLVMLVAVRFVPLAVGTSWLWGVGQLTLLPSGYLIGYAILGAIALILPLLPGSAAWGEKIAVRFTTCMYESKSKYLARGIVVVAFGILFALLPMPTHFLGDGYTYLANVASSTGHFLKWSEAGAMWVLLAVQSLVGPKSDANALLAFQIVAVASGIVTIWFYFLIARVLSRNATGRMVTFLTLTLSSTLLLFFGYVESYPILWGPVAGFVYFSLRYSIEGKGIVGALSCLVIATALHLQVGMFYPAVGYLLLSRGAGPRFYRRFKPVVWSAVAIMVVGGLVLFVRKFGSDLAFENIFLLSSKPGYESYTLFSGKHIVDMINLLVLVSPMALVLLGLTIGSWKRRALEPTSVYLGLLTIGSLLFLLLIDPGLGMARDWDLFSLCGLAPVLWLLYMVCDENIAALNRMTLGVGVALIAFALPFLAVNLDKSRSIEYVKRIIDDNPSKSFGTISILQTYYRDHGDQKRLDSLATIRQARYPEFYAMQQATFLLHSGNLTQAEDIFRRIPPNRFSKDYHAFLAEAALRKGWVDSAVYHAEACIQLQPYYDRSYMTIGSAYLMSKQPDKALEVLQRGYALNRENVPILVGLGAAHLALGNYDSTLVYCRLALAQVPDAPESYYVLTKAYVGMGLEQKAMQAGRKFLEVGPGTEGFEMYRKVLVQLLPQLDSAVESSGAGKQPTK